MAKSTYNNVENASTSHILLKLNCKYYLKLLFIDKINLYLRSCSANKLSKEWESW